jgi:hypothetical protein
VSTRRRLFPVVLGAWRAALVLLLVAVASQPVTMGLYLSGRYPMMGWHGLVGSIVAALALVVVGLTLLYAVAGGRLWPVPVTVGMFLACGFQIGMGYARNLGIHVPLGVAVVSAALLLTVWSWTRGAGRFREPRHPS